MDKKTKKIFNQYRIELGKGAPIEYKGFTLYPLQMEQIYYYDTLQNVLRQDPDNPFANMPYMTMLYCLDMADSKAGIASYRIHGLVWLMSLALGVYDPSKESGEQYNIDGHVGEDGFVYLVITANQEQKIIDESLFRKIRMIIALQNNIELPTEGGNNELRKSYEWLQQQNANQVDVNIEDLIDSFCAHQHMIRQDVFNKYSIKEFFKQCDSIERELAYNIYNNGQWSFKDQTNPFKHWAYKISDTAKYGLIPTKLSENVVVGSSKDLISSQYN